jgi:hypothetical protein
MARNRNRRSRDGRLELRELGERLAFGVQQAVGVGAGETKGGDARSKPREALDALVVQRGSSAED